MKQSLSEAPDDNSAAGVSDSLIKEVRMNDQSNTLKGKAFNLEQFVDYADGSVVSKTLLKKDIDNITGFPPPWE